MSFQYGNRVHETSAVVGTGSYTLLGAVTGMQGFVDGIGSGIKTTYVASLGADWEIGIGTITSGSPSTVSRSTILDSSDGGAPIDWPDASEKDIICAVPAEHYDRRSVQKTANFTINPDDPNVVYECVGTSGQIVATLPTGSLAKSGFPARIINAGSGTLQVSVRADGYPTGEKVNGSITGFELLRPGQSITMRLLDSEDDWYTLSDGNIFTNSNVLASAQGRTVLRTSGDGDAAIEGAAMDLGSGVLARASTTGTPFTDANEDDWLITVKSTTEITFKNVSGGTVEYFWMRQRSPYLADTLADGASININLLATYDDFWFQAGSATTQKTLRAVGFVSATNFHLNWQIGRG